MSLELHLRFTDPSAVVVKLEEEETDPIPFKSPINHKDLGDIRWYLETYAAKYTTKIDDQAADRIAQKLPGWGAALFEAVFGERAAARIFDRFQEEEEEGRILTLSASHPQVLSLPWELLRDPNGTYLVHERPRVTIRRRWSGSSGGRRPFRVQTKERVRVLMVVSRPEGAGFLDPRVEAQAVLRAAQRVGDRVEVEFLRPATLVGLNRRLEDRSLPGVDILHFDGHGVFDPDGRWHEKAKGSDPGAMKGSEGSQGNVGYLLFEDEQGREALVSAETVGDLLNRQRIGLVVLSACQSAVETMRSVLQENLIDAAAVRRCLEQRATLVILDNLEVLDPDPLHELLTVAKGWSEAGSSRVLITTRQPDLGHPDYPTQGSWNHQSRALKGLDPGDALAYLQQLMKVPPAPEQDLPEDRVLQELFAQVQYHPLAIRVLARELKVRRPAELGSRLEVLVREDPENPLLASLNLSLERLDPEVQRWIPRLGVFQGGAFENVLLAITEFSEAEWQAVRQGLEATGLIQPERIPQIRVPYLKFHPALAPALWSRLDPSTQQDLLARHRQRYYQLSRYLYGEDDRNPLPTRAIAQRELPNLLVAVNGSLAAGDPEAVEFVECVNMFLSNFGLTRDQAALSEKAVQAGGEVGSQAWVLARSNQGEQLFQSGRIQGRRAGVSGDPGGVGTGSELSALSDVGSIRPMLDVSEPLS